MKGLVRVIRNPKTGGIQFGGIDMGGSGTVVSEDGDILVVKFPSSSGWNGRGCPRIYVSPSIFVLHRNKEAKLSGSTWYSIFISWEVKNRKL